MKERDRDRSAADARGEARDAVLRRAVRGAVQVHQLPRHVDLGHLLDRRDHRRDDHDVRERRVAHRRRSARCARSAFPRARSSPRSSSSRCCSGCSAASSGSLPRRSCRRSSISTMNFQTFAELAFRFTLTPRDRRGVAGLRAGDGLRRRLPAGGARRAAEDRRRAAGGLRRSRSARSLSRYRMVPRSAVRALHGDLGIDLARHHVPAGAWSPRKRRSLYRFALAAALIAGWLPCDGALAALPAAAPRAVRAQGALFFGLNYVAIYRAEQYVASGLVAVLFSTIAFMSLFGTRVHVSARRSRRARSLARRSAWAASRCCSCPSSRRRGAGGDAALGIALGLGGTALATGGNLVVDAHAAPASADRRDDGMGHGLRRAHRRDRGDCRAGVTWSFDARAVTSSRSPISRCSAASSRSSPISRC